MGVSHTNVRSLSNEIFDQSPISHISEGLRRRCERQCGKSSLINSIDIRATVEQQFNRFKATVVGGLLEWGCSKISFANVDFGTVLKKQFNPPT